jgi:hypothetical protein
MTQIIESIFYDNFWQYFAKVDVTKDDLYDNFWQAFAKVDLYDSFWQAFAKAYSSFCTQ